jgi:hypothetical protein
MGEARNRFNGSASMIDTSVSDRAIRRARREFVSALADRILVSMATADMSWPAEAMVKLAWQLADLHYEEMMRRMAMTDEVTLTERMAADRTVSDVTEMAGR